MKIKNCSLIGLIHHYSNIILSGGNRRNVKAVRRQRGSRAGSGKAEEGERGTKEVLLTTATYVIGASVSIF